MTTRRNRRAKSPESFRAVEAWKSTGGEHLAKPTLSPRIALLHSIDPSGLDVTWYTTGSRPSSLMMPVAAGTRRQCRRERSPLSYRQPTSPRGAPRPSHRRSSPVTPTVLTGSTRRTPTRSGHGSRFCGSRRDRSRQRCAERRLFTRLAAAERMARPCPRTGGGRQSLRQSELAAQVPHLVPDIARNGSTSFMRMRRSHVAPEH